MYQIRKASDRGHFHHGWLNTYHTFSFGEYFDPAHMNFRALRVMNDDRIEPGMGFGMHGHRDMEILTYVLSGSLEHRDSMGHGEILQPGEFQRMSAGTGVRHSEFNPSTKESTHLYQIWLMPERNGLTPSYEQKRFADDEKRDRLRIVASPDGADGSLTINQDARVYLATLNPGKTVAHEIAPDRHAWLQVLRGGVSVKGESLRAGDGLAVSGERNLTIEGTESSEVMLFDLA